jgi:hypothetical protein
MTDDYLLRYFTAEKHESLLFLAVGMAALVASWLIWRHAARYKGMIGPLAAIAAIQIVVGGTVFLRTDVQVAELQRKRVVAPAAFKAEEGRRMTAVMRSFGLYMAIEAALLVVGIGLAAGLRRRPRWHAFGLGLALQAAVMLVLDLFAENRGQHYLDAVLRL